MKQQSTIKNFHLYDDSPYSLDKGILNFGAIAMVCYQAINFSHSTGFSLRG